jgi:hypothetical protein
LPSGLFSRAFLGFSFVIFVFSTSLLERKSFTRYQFPQTLKIPLRNLDSQTRNVEAIRRCFAPHNRSTAIDPRRD